MVPFLSQQLFILFMSIQFILLEFAQKDFKVEIPKKTLFHCTTNLQVDLIYSYKFHFHVVPSAIPSS